jgi:hypothetical protein
MDVQSARGRLSRAVHVTGGAETVLEHEGMSEREETDHADVSAI